MEREIRTSVDHIGTLMFLMGTMGMDFIPARVSVISSLRGSVYTETARLVAAQIRLEWRQVWDMRGLSDRAVLELWAAPTTARFGVGVQRDEAKALLGRVAASLVAVSDDTTSWRREKRARVVLLQRQVQRRDELHLLGDRAV